MNGNVILPNAIPTCCRNTGRIAQTLLSPDQIRRSARFSGARLFSRWYNDLRGGKHVVVVVVSEPEAGYRHWIITAYLARKLAPGDIEWTRN